jgi:predicted O-methyltransferase YrrM
MDWRNALSIDGWMTEEQLEWLYTIAQGMNSIIEVGSWMGRSTYALCAGCKGTVYAIDDFMGSSRVLNSLIKRGADPYQSFIANTKGFTNLKLIKMRSVEASLCQDIPQKVDMIFIDGDHSFDAVLTDLETWDSRAEKLICGHDYVRQFKQVRFAVNQFYSGKKEVLHGMWMVYK